MVAAIISSLKGVEIIAGRYQIIRRVSMRYIKYISVFLVVSLILCSCGKAKGLSKKEKVEDFEYMCKIISENHPALGASDMAAKWEQLKKDNLEKVKKSDSDDSFQSIISAMVKSLNDNNTFIVSNKEYVDIKGDFEENKFWKEQLERSEVIERYKDAENVDNKEENKDTTTKDTEKKDAKEHRNMLVEKVTTKGESTAVNYVRIYTFNKDTAEEDMKIIRDIMKSNDSSKLILDLRFTKVGTDSYWTNNLAPTLFAVSSNWSTCTFYRDGEYLKDFLGDVKEKKPISEMNSQKTPWIAKESFQGFDYFTENSLNIGPKENINFKGKIYILIDEKYCCHAALNFAKFAKINKAAKLVGSVSNPKGVGTAIAALPKSGYLLVFANSVTKDSIDNKELSVDISDKGYTGPDLTQDTAIKAVAKD